MTQKLGYDFRITFEDNTRINFTGEGIQEIEMGVDKSIRHRHMKLVSDIVTLCKDYMKEQSK